MPQNDLGRPEDVATPIANTEAKVTYNAVTGRAHVVSGLAWSYKGGTPTGGRLRIIDGGLTIFDIDITAAGHGVIYFHVPKNGRGARSMELILTAGGPGITGKLSVLGHWLIKG